MMNSLEKDLPALECASHFKHLMNPTAKVSAREWMNLCRSMLTDLNCTPDELKAFMTWAAQENTDPKPQFDSVEYLAKANDPMATLVKHSASLYRVWRSRKQATRSRPDSGYSMSPERKKRYDWYMSQAMQDDPAPVVREPTPLPPPPPQPLVVRDTTPMVCSHCPATFPNDIDGCYALARHNLAVHRLVE
jgi:hypothetical protein